jgi:pimeloyl-ACP methyl ester carboxylesterase
MFSYQRPPLLRNVTTPTLLVWGRDDRVAPVECGEIYAATLPHARLVVLEDAGHYVDVEKPAELARLIIEHTGSS